jgi:predicted RNA-binding protein with PIN domain
MPYLIDGHNLIGSFPGFSLSDPEDERKLAELLSRYAAKIRRRMIVFFDGGQAGSGAPRLGLLTARFIPPPRTADDAIRDFLRRESDPHAYTVITSDRQLAENVRRIGAISMNARAFAQIVLATVEMRKKQAPPADKGNIDEWLLLFEKKDGTAHKK